MRAHLWFTVTVHCYCTLYTVHCPCTLSMMSLSTVTVHGTLYSGTVRCNCTLHTTTARCHYTLSLYTVHCTLYPRSHRMYPHTKYVRHNDQVSILALYTVTLPSLYALTIHCHCTLSLYTVTVHLVRVFLGGGGWYFEPPSLQSFNPPPPQLQPEPKEQLQPQ